VSAAIWHVSRFLQPQKVTGSTSCSRHHAAADKPLSPCSATTRDHISRRDSDDAIGTSNGQVDRSGDYRPIANRLKGDELFDAYVVTSTAAAT
jgi:hypothetical protein